MPRAVIGDVIEIRVGHGLAYAQYTHRHTSYGAMLRVFRGLHSERPDDWKTLVDGELVFSCFYQMGAALNDGLVAKVGKVNVPLRLQAFPLFRAGVVDPATRKVANWWLWDGTKEWQVGVLTPEQRSLPIRGIWNHTLLVERIDSGWTAETDPT